MRVSNPCATRSSNLLGLWTFQEPWAEAYYQKGVNLLGKATLQGGKTIAPPGTAEAFQKYLEIAPTGPNAQSAKDLLTSIGSTVETSYGTKKKPVKK